MTQFKERLKERTIIEHEKVDSFYSYGMQGSIRYTTSKCNFV